MKTLNQIKMNKFIFVVLALLTSTGLSAQKWNNFEISAEIGANNGVGVERHSFAIAALNIDYKISKLSRLGLGGGAGLTTGRYDKMIFPVYARMKLYFLDSKISPFFLLNVGYTFSSSHKPGEGFGVMFAPYLGVDFSFFKNNGFYAMVGTNYQSHIVFNNTNINSDYINKFLWGPQVLVGYRF